MRDRLPAYGMTNRVKITQDDGTIVEGVLSYADGATQQGSAYNKANVLPDIVCKTLGLSTESEPRDMFDVLAHVGDLHVWKKTVVTESEVPAVPAGYNISPMRNVNLTIGIPMYSDTTNGVWEYIEDVSGISVSNNGEIRFSNAQTLALSGDMRNYDLSELNVLKGKYIRCVSLPKGWLSEGIVPSSSPTVGAAYYIPQDATFSKKNFSTGINYGGETIYYFEVLVDKYKNVDGYPYTPAIPAGTAITYPVSTNRNAYQESSSIKAAGYVLGSIVNGYFQMGWGATTFPENVPLIKYGSSVSVSDDGNISIQNETQLAITSDTSSASMEKLKGKFFRYTQLPFSPTNFSMDEVYFIPSSATFTKERTGYWYVDKYQTVTGYAAVPAGTKIEYLGALGEKTIIEKGSYVGTGTYGMNNKNKIQFKKPPKLLIVQNIGNGNRVLITLYGGTTVSPTGSGTSSSGQLYITWSDTSVSWYADSAMVQLNNSGQTYNYLLVY